MRLERVTELTEPPVVGRSYLVPCVRYAWFHWRSLWPVFLPRHNDREFFDFDYQHYHVDPRFVSRRYYHLSRQGREFFSSPLTHRDAPEPVLEGYFKRLCRRDMRTYPYSHVAAVRAIRRHYEGVQCERGPAGWICPHRRTPLGSFPVVDGVVTCPLHGLRVAADTGIVCKP